MIIINKVSELETYVARERNNGRSIGLVPTMGALHAGHLSLVERAVKENDDVIVSVFVNPTQFNNPDDLATYPRTEEEDCRLLAKGGVSVAFVPDVKEMYPQGAVHEKDFELGTAAEVMEGKFRPGHFQGVAQIVSRLFELCRPNRAYFGEKDFQQIAVIKNMVESEGIDVDIIPCPIKRADDGLALSSRNALLTPEQRAVAPAIYKALKEGVEYSKTHTVRETHDMIVNAVNANAGLETEYLEIVDARTLLPVEKWEESPEIQGCITVYCGKVRLIDNIKFR
ncbi:MAG: pantoate--beta-alanine ligase [Muribaculaceae bacterium]|nr:pantoate--beta-alanine ligase [Muribaculaceae bacterium]